MRGCVKTTPRRWLMVGNRAMTNDMSDRDRREIQESIECVGYQLLRIEEQLSDIAEALGVELPRKPVKPLDLDAFTFDPSAHIN